MGKNAGHPMQVPGQCPGRREISPVSLAGYRNKGTSPNLGQDGTTLYKLAKAQLQLSPCTSSARHSCFWGTCRFASFPNNSASGKGRHSDVSFKFHLFLRTDEVFFLNLPINSSLSLQVTICPVSVIRT